LCASWNPLAAKMTEQAVTVRTLVADRTGVRDFPQRSAQRAVSGLSGARRME
jgi:hypothetical protein